jgi:hypothetical protein
MKITITATILALLLNGCLGMVPSAWSDAGFKSVNKCNYWKSNGFTPQEAKKWRNQGFKTGDAKEWKKAGFTPQEAKILDGNRVNFATAKLIKSFHFSIDELSIYLQSVKGNESIKSYLQAGVTPQELKDGFPTSYAKWFDSGLTKEDVKNWKEIMKDLYDSNRSAVRIFNGSFYHEYEYVKVLKEKKIKPEVYKTYTSIISDEHIIYAIEHNISAKHLKDIKQVLKVNKLTQPSSALIALAVSNIKLQYIPDYFYAPNNILMDKQKSKILLFFCNSVEKNKLSEFSPFSTAGKCYVYNGKVTAIKDEWTVEIKECVKTDNQFNDCMGGRISLMTFNDKIPSTMSRGSKYIGIVKSVKPIKTFLYGNSSANTELISPIVEE